MNFFKPWIERDQRGEWLTLPPEHLDKHGILIGAPGTGKTESLLRIAALVRKYYNWQIIYLDLKGDPQAQQRFVAAMNTIPNTRIHSFPASQYDGWRGNNNALYNKLMGIQDFSEPYYKSITSKMLRLALNAPTGTPRNSKEFLANLDLDTLRKAYKGHPEEKQLEMEKRLAAGVNDRYWSFFASLEGKLDGDIAYEDADALYILVEGLALREEAKSLGRFLIEDFVNYVPTRKAPGTMTLLLVDEISTLDLNAEGFSTFEKARSYGASIIASAQTYEGLGPYRERISGSSHLILLHRCNDPDEIVQRAGRKQQINANWSVDAAGTATGQGSMSLRPQWRVDPDEVRQLPVGELFVLCQGSAQKALVAKQPISPEQLQAAQRIINQEKTSNLQRQQQQQEPPKPTAAAVHPPDAL
jgi:hypothetical protein